MPRHLALFAFVLAACTASFPQRDDAPDRAAEYYAMRRAGSDDPVRDLARARQAVRGMRHYSTASDAFQSAAQRLDSCARPFDEWRFLGPGNIGGRTRVLVIQPDPTRRERLYLGTDLGVFVSLDGGAHWSVENTGFANVVTETVVIGRGDLGPAVYAFTHGRGAWRAELTIAGARRRSVRQ